MTTILVTGGTGFLGGHCILALLKAGHRVRTTVRSLSREQEVRAMLRAARVDAGNHLSFCVADLMLDTGWPEAAVGCDFVLHVASPFPPGEPKNEDELIVPARDGALRVLRAARDAGVKRVVLTSSFAAVGYGHAPQIEAFDETVWTDLSRGPMAAYPKSKTLAERAAWDFINREGGTLELSVVNPVAIFGPALSADLAGSMLLLKALLDGAMPACPRLHFGVVDVRDVVDLHMRAMVDPAAKGERFLATAGGCMSIAQIGKVLKTRLGEAGKRAPTRELPDWVVRAVALFSSAARQAVPELGKLKSASSAKAKHTLQWTPRSSEDAIVAAAHSLVQLGLLKPS